MYESYGVLLGSAWASSIFAMASVQFFAWIAACAAIRGFATSGLSFCLVSLSLSLSLSLSAATAAETGSKAPPVTPTRPAAVRAAISTRFAFFIIGLFRQWKTVIANCNAGHAG